MEKKWIPHTHDDYPLESSQKSLNVTTNQKITLLSSCSTLCSNSTSNSSIIIDSTSHANGKIGELGAPNVWVKRPIFINKYQFVNFFV